MNCLFNRLGQFIIRRVFTIESGSYFPKWCRIGKPKSNKGYRWIIGEEGELIWKVNEDKEVPHYDHLEMSGFSISAIISYGVDENRRLKLNRHLAFPMLRLKPNRTRDNLGYNFGSENELIIRIDDMISSNENVYRFEINYGLKIFTRKDEKIELRRNLVPMREEAAFVEEIRLRNITNVAIKLEINLSRICEKTVERKGIYGEYIIKNRLLDYTGKEISEEGVKCQLNVDKTVTVYIVYQANKKGEKTEYNFISAADERRKFVDELRQGLVLNTPDQRLNRMFDLAKVRTCESIFKTKNGLMHSPGGGSYYAAMWMNDQCEYVNPLFPFIGYEVGIKQSINCYRMFKEYIDKNHKKSPVTSIISEGDKTWNMVGDRGDAAMYAYGVGRFCLALGDKEVSENLWEGIVDALEYSLLQKNSHGIIRSNTDELEHRFSSGRANLFTSSLMVDALRSATCLGHELNKSREIIQRYDKERKMLQGCIEEYFGAYIEGYNTYRYHKVNKKLRGWICIPLAMGIMTRKDETIKAIFSERLWNGEGIRTESGCDIFWDRTTLYALRGAFIGGHTEEAIEKLLKYSSERLLGEHVPYPVESHPEGNQKHLSGESALYIRVFTEGLFGIRPIGFNTFICEPHLPKDWGYMILERVRLFRKCFTLKVLRVEDEICLRVEKEGGEIYIKRGRGPFRVTI